MNNDRTNSLKTSRKGERGSVLAMTAISMFSLLLAAGLAIDISHFYTAKAELQNAADAASLAAASQLNSTTGGIQCAVTEATKALNNYDFKNIVTITSSDVTFAQNLNGTYVDYASAQANPTMIRFVKVTLAPKPVDATFSSIVISKTQNLSATATAGMSVGLTMNKFYTAFAFIESAATPLVKGNSYLLDARAGTVSTPSSYRVLTGPDGDLILTGQIHAYGYIGINYNVANLSQAEMCRYAKVGMNTRFGDYTVHPSVNPSDEPPDIITEEGLTYAQYTAKQGAGEVQASNGVKNRRVFTAPIGLDSTYNTTARTVVGNKLGAFFVKSKIGTSCQLEVEFIGAPIVVPEGTFDPNGTAMSDITIPVLYK